MRVISLAEEETLGKRLVAGHPILEAEVLYCAQVRVYVCVRVCVREREEGGGGRCGALPSWRRRPQYRLRAGALGWCVLAAALHRNPAQNPPLFSHHAVRSTSTASSRAARASRSCYGSLHCNPTQLRCLTMFYYTHQRAARVLPDGGGLHRAPLAPRLPGRQVVRGRAASDHGDHGGRGCIFNIQ